MSDSEKSKSELLQELQELRAENETLKISESRFRNLLMDVQYVSVQGYGPDGTTQYWNHASEHLYGYTLEEAIGRNLLELIIPPEMRGDVKKAIQFMAETGQPIPSSELTLMRKDGSNVSVYSSHTIIKVPGRPQELFCIDIDLTEQKETERALRSSQSLFRDLVETSQDLIWQCDIEGRYTYLNPAWETIFGYKLEEMLGKKFIEFQNPEQAEKDKLEFVKLLNNNIVKGLETTHIGKAGNEIHLVFNAKSVIDENGKVIGTRGTAYDITERKKVEDELRKGEEIGKYGHWVLYLNEKLMTSSDGASKIYGLDKNENTLEQIQRMALDEYRPMLNIALNDVINNGTEYNTQFKIRRESDGKIIDIHSIAEYDATNNIIFGTIQDITQLKEAERALIESEEKFHLIIENASEAILFTEPNGAINFANPEACKMFGHSIEDFKTIGRSGIMDTSDPRLALALEERKLTGKFKGELSCIRRDGTIFPVELTSNVFIDSKGIERTSIIINDISKRKQYEAELKSNQEQTEALLKAIPDIMFILNKDGVFLDYHATALTLLYAPPEDFIGKHISDVLPSELVKEYAPVFQNAVNSKQIQFLEYPLTLSDGTHYFESRIIAYQEDKILNITRDITRNKLAELEIQNKNAELSEINASKDKFFSIIAHDLKSPLSGFLGLSKIMAEDLQSFTVSELQNNSKKMQESANNLYKFLENLLEWSRIQRGVTPFNPDICDVYFIVKQNLELLNDFATNKDIKLLNNIENGLEVFADVQMLYSIFRNLLFNAVKFTQRGGQIEIGVESNADNYCTLYIKDNGIGMNKAILGQIFRLDGKVSRKGTEGELSTGLGLLLCKEFVEKNGGKIWVESEEGIGSTFYFKLPKTSEKKTNNKLGSL